MEAQTIFTDIREKCHVVSRMARHVQIVAERIPEVIEPLLGQSLAVPSLDTTAHFVDEVEPTTAFFVALAAINFGSGFFPHIQKKPGLSGYYTIAHSLAEHFDAQGPFSAEQLAAIGPDDCAELFGQDRTDPAVDQLMSLFAQAWNDLGKDLIARFNGNFSTCIEAANHQAALLVRVLSKQPLFRDVSTYHGIDVPFYKRSQLLASDLSLAFGGDGLGRFDDLDHLTIFADNLVPHVLRLEGILQYDRQLLSRIESEQLIPAGSDEEIEIRACCIHAVELMIQLAAERSYLWTARDVDQLLWHRGQLPHYKKRDKRHRTRTAFY